MSRRSCAVRFLGSALQGMFDVLQDPASAMQRDHEQRDREVIGTKMEEHVGDEAGAVHRQEGGAGWFCIPPSRGPSIVDHGPCLGSASLCMPPAAQGERRDEAQRQRRA